MAVHRPPTHTLFLQDVILFRRLQLVRWMLVEVVGLDLPRWHEYGWGLGVLKQEQVVPMPLPHLIHVCLCLCLSMSKSIYLYIFICICSYLSHC